MKNNNSDIINTTDSIRRFRIPLRIVTVLILVALLVLLWVGMLGSPYDRTDSTYSNFVIEEYDTIADVASKLHEEGYVRKASDFELLTKLTFSDEFREGTYFLSPSMSSFSIIQTFNSGLTTSEGFSIPAGYTVEQIATSLDRDGFVDKEAFLKAASSEELKAIDILAEGSEGLTGTDLIEGFLFPSDYVLSADADESMIIIMMVDAFSNFYTDDYRARADEMGLTPREVLIIASMIEKETSIDKERAAVSSVIHNRYNLEIATDEEIPEHPLCSPSRESIIAALYPEETDNIHYVLSSRLDGSHKFADNDEEYEALLEEYNNAVADKEAAESDDSVQEGEE